MSEFKVGDSIKLNLFGFEYFKADSFTENWADVTHHLYDGGSTEILSIKGAKLYTEDDVFFTSHMVELADTVAESTGDNYAAAFNMWMDMYLNDPQSFETSYDSAMRHVSEKLGGIEPSYGEVAAEQFKGYLEKVK